MSAEAAPSSYYNLRRVDLVIDLTESRPGKSTETCTGSKGFLTCSTGFACP